jgi:hypothetical protein
MRSDDRRNLLVAESMAPITSANGVRVRRQTSLSSRHGFGVRPEYLHGRIGALCLTERAGRGGPRALTSQFQLVAHDAAALPSVAVVRLWAAIRLVS